MSERSAFALPVVSELRVGERGAVTRVVLTLSDQVKYQAFTLQDPHRVVVDLPEVRWTPRADTPGPAEGVVDRIRLGRFNRGTSRIVIDCRAQVSVRAISLQPAPAGGYRLLIDMAPSPAGSGRPAKGPTVVGGSEMRPVIGATGLPSGDLAPEMAGRTGDPVAMGSTFAAPKPRPQKSASPAVPPWVVAIDAGHGDQDPGAISPNGTYEKRITLAMARALRDELKALGRFRVVLTRDSDTFIRLRSRIAIAHAAGADLFISLHADKAENPATRGLSVYTLSEQASDAEAAALAEKENRVDMLGGFRLKGEAPDVTDILIDLVQRDTKNQSAQFASLLMRELGEDT
ncbi:MAG: N-acetylmuramoyl-L-alanine amidase, partial [Rhodospirillales bacterium]